MATLLVANSEGEPHRFDIPESGADVVLGRKSDNGIAIPDPHLSSQHASIRFDKEAETFYLKDLGSHNGTRVNGGALEEGKEVSIKESDAIKFGILEATLLLHRPVRSLEPKPLKRPKIEAPAPVIPIIDAETLKAATKKPKVQAIKAADVDESMPETLRVDDVCRDLIKRLDLLDDLIERYQKGENTEIVSDLEILKQSFQDMLGQYQVEPYSFDPDTEIDLEMRKKIQVVETVKKRSKEKTSRILETVNEGYMRRLEGSQPVILRKARVTTQAPMVAK